MKRRLPADSYKQGIITDIRQVGGLPEYKGEPIVDSDGDGMPDAWEIANGLNPNDPSDAVKDCNGDGYTNIEKYINGMDGFEEQLRYIIQTEKSAIKVCVENKVYCNEYAIENNPSGIIEYRVCAGICANLCFTG